MATARELKKAQAMIAAHARQEQAKRETELRAFIGRYFKTKNRYSSGEDWWLYATVTDVDDGRVTGTSFEATTNSQLEIHQGTYLGMIPSGTWTEITPDEFWVAAAQMLGKCAALLVKPIGGWADQGVEDQ